MKKAVPVFLLVLLGVALYGSSLTGPFLGWDDNQNVFENAVLLSGDWLSFWHKPYFGMYIPVTYTFWTWLADLHPANPLLFRIFNLCLHVTNALLVFHLTRKFFRRMPEWGAWLVAALFLVHPLQVESVAWVSGGRDLLSSFWALSSMAVFFSGLRFRQLAALLLFLLALLSKPAVIFLPLVIWILSLLQNPKAWKTASFHMIPWVLIAAPVMVVTQLIQSVKIQFNLDWFERPLIMLDAWGFYLGKMIWPLNLSVDYGRSPQWVLSNPAETLGPILCLSVFTILAIWKRTRSFFGGAFLVYLSVLLPVSGLVSFSFQETSTVTDHYAYLAVAVFFMAVVAGWAELTGGSLRNRIGPGLGLLAVLAFSILSFQRISVWMDEEVFFKDMIQKNPESYAGQTGLGFHYVGKKDYAKAEVHYMKAYDMNPKRLTSVANKAFIQLMTGRSGEVVQLDPELDSEAYLKVAAHEPVIYSRLLMVTGVAWANLGRPDKAFERTCRALQYNPLNPDARQNIGTIETVYRQQDPKAHCPY